MNFNEKLINLRKSKGLSQEELGNELKVSRQTISKWESCQSYPDFQRLVLLSDFFGLTLDELVRDIDVQEVREKNLNNEKLSSIYDDVNEGKKFITTDLRDDLREGVNQTFHPGRQGIVLFRHLLGQFNHGHVCGFRGIRDFARQLAFLLRIDDQQFDFT